MNQELEDMVAKHQSKERPMGPEIEVQFYRMINVAYGVLESSERVRSELMNLRHLQIASRKKSLEQRFLGLAFILVAAIPTLYALLPGRLESKELIGLGAVAALTIVYLFIIAQQWREEKKEAETLQTLLPPGATAAIEERPEFLGLLLSSYRTRWQMASTILKENPASPTSEMFVEIKLYWERRMASMTERLRGLTKEGSLSGSEYEALIKWLPKELEIIDDNKG